MFQKNQKFVVLSFGRIVNICHDKSKLLLKTYPIVFEMFRYQLVYIVNRAHRFTNKQASQSRAVKIYRNAYINKYTNTVI